MEDLANTVEQNAAKPAKATVDGNTVEQHPLEKQIEAVRFYESKRASRLKRFPIRFAKMLPPGAD